MSLDLLTASPPCQPFTRQGSKRDMQDARTNSFQHLLENVLPYLKCPPRNILIENVKGFETSKMRDMLIRTLRQTNYDYAEFLLEPQALGIPNSRLRYYCLAKLAPATFCFDQSDPKHIISQFPCTLRPDRCLSCDNTLLNRRSSLKVTSQKLCDFVQTEHEVDSKYLIAPAILTRYYPVFDIVDKESVQSCCFTKGYGTLVKGAGSYFTPMPLQTVLDTFHQFEQIHREVGEIDQIPERHVKQLQQTRLRYFTSIEIARLLRFPEHFSFPDNYSDKQKWRLLGNSINVHVVCNLMMLLLAEMSSNS